MYAYVCVCATESWDQAYQAYLSLVQLLGSAGDAAAAAKAAGFQRRAAEAASKAGLHTEAEICWQQLLSTASEGDTHTQAHARSQC